MNETYNLTETDISLLSYYLGIPIVMLYQGRNRFKLATYKKFNNLKYKYYVKIIEIREYVYYYKGTRS